MNRWTKQGGNLFRPVGFLAQCDAKVLDRALPEKLYLATREGVHASEDGVGEPTCPPLVMSLRVFLVGGTNSVRCRYYREQERDDT